MGPLRKRTFQNKGFREEPLLATRMQEYRTHLEIGGVIIHGEKIIVGVHGGGLALVTALPEVIVRGCQRNNKTFKRGDVTVVIDVLTAVREEIATEAQISNSTVDYVRTTKLRNRTVLLSDIILPVIVEGVTRSNLFPCDVLDPSQRSNGLDIYRIRRCDVEMISEREREFFSSITD